MTALFSEKLEQLCKTAGRDAAWVEYLREGIKKAIKRYEEDKSISLLMFDLETLLKLTSTEAKKE